MSEISNGKRLAELFEFKNGRSFKKSDWSEKGLPIIRIQNLNDICKPFNRFNGDYDPTIEVNNGDLLFSWSGTVGSSFGPHIWERGKGVLNQHIYKITFKNDTSVRYAYFALLHITAEIEKSVRGAVGLVHVTKTDLKEFRIPHPSLTEQKRIVAILDEAFGAIAKAKENAEKNLANAKELFDSYLNRVFTEKGEGWEEKKLGEIAQFKNGLNFDKNSNGQTLPIVGVGDFENNFLVNLDCLESATIDGQLEGNYAIMKDDILTVRSNGSKDLIGRCMLVPELNEVTSYSGFVIRIRMDKSTVLPKFLLHFMKCRNTVYLLTRDGGGANIHNINQRKLSSLIVCYPVSLGEQDLISKRIDRLNACSLKLKLTSEKKLAALNELKQSILQKAFTGQLTAKSPELELVP